MSANEIFNDIRSFCQNNTNEDNIKKYSRYFKEGYDSWGLSSGQVEFKANEILEKYNASLDEIFGTGMLLLKDNKYEEVSILAVMLKKNHKKYNLQAFEHLSKWFDIGIKNWAHTDFISGDILSQFLIKKVVELNNFSDWRFAESKFKRRAVPVTMIKLLKKTSDFTPFYDFIEPMMMDKEREVHQGLGWFLREAWKLNKPDTEEFLMKWKDKAARLIFQYACEKMTPEEKQRFKKSK